MNHSSWLQNRSGTCALAGKTPYEARHGKKPNLAGIQEFGAAAYVKDLSAGKLDSRARVGRFVGYDSKSKGYRIYWPKARKVLIERDIYMDKQRVFELETVQIEGENADKLPDQANPAPQPNPIARIDTAIPEPDLIAQNDAAIPDPDPDPPKNPPI